MKTTKKDRVALVDMVAGKRVWMDGGEWASLAIMGLIVKDEFGDEWIPSEAGRAVAAEEKIKLDAAKAKRNANARARSSVMSSLGMRRTSGGWE